MIQRQLLPLLLLQNIFYSLSPRKCSYVAVSHPARWVTITLYYHIGV